MFADYQRLVIQDLEQKKLNNKLSLRLVHATPAKLKQECLEVYSTRFEKRDENTIKVFFGERTNAASYEQLIERCDTDKFRPLINYLRGIVINTDVRNIELLAWLINFEPRPWQFQKNYETLEPENPKLVGVKPVKNEPGADENISSTGKAGNDEPIVYKSSELAPIAKTQKRKLTPLIVIFALVIISGYMLWRKYRTATSLSSNESCMYWNVDHYEQISCSEKPTGDVLVIAFDSAKIRNFKRIMRPDTITYNAIGKVWYIKRNSKLEYYTSKGRHPEYPNLLLRPITGYIIKTHILQGAEK